MSARAIPLAVMLAAALSACGRQSPPAPAPLGSAQQRAQGAAALVAYGCVACHHVKGLHPTGRFVGPPLDHLADNSYVGGVLPNNAAALERFIVSPRRVSPGTAMPDLGVSAADARAIAAYLYSQ
jgi:cytochrome c2